jgi:hypothetical protein
LRGAELAQGGQINHSESVDTAQVRRTECAPAGSCASDGEAANDSLVLAVAFSFQFLIHESVDERQPRWRRIVILLNLAAAEPVPPTAVGFPPHIVSLFLNRDW